MREILEDVLEMLDSFRCDEDPKDLYDRLGKIESYVLKELSDGRHLHV